MAQSSAPATRVVDRIDESNLLTLKGNTHPAATVKNDRGRVSPDLAMGDLVMVLSRGTERQAAFDRFVASQYEQGSPNYHRWLEPAQVGEQFGPAESDVDAVSNWLRNHGFSVDEVSKDRMSIRFSGTAGQVESAFHTEIHNLLVKGEQHIGNMADPRIPAALAPVVVGVKALHNFFPRPLYRLGPKVRRDSDTGKWTRVNPDGEYPKLKIPGEVANRPHGADPLAAAHPDFGLSYQGSQYEFVVPYDLAKIYNIKPLWSASTPVDGTGQTIAIAGTSNIVLSDVASFRQQTGLPPNVPTVVITNTDPGSGTAALAGDRLENTLDVEWSGAIAKGAQIILVASSAPTASTDPLWLSEQYIVNNKTAPIMNVSYGECELGMGTAGNAQYNTLWQTAASEGIAVFVATGDSGSASCDQGSDGSNSYYTAVYGLAVSGMSSTPYNVAVGGTDLNWGDTASPYWSSTNDAANLSSALGYMPEVPWNDSVGNTVVDAALNAANNVNYDAETWANTLLYNLQIGNITISTYVSFVGAVGGTGGVSNCTTNDQSTVASCTGGYAKPSWQAGVTGIVASDKRTVPDVSFFAADGVLGSAYLICDTLWPSGSGTVAASCDFSNSTNALNQGVGGTSASSPVMAGVMALINQKAGAPQGNPNPELYKLAGNQNYSSCSSEAGKANSACLFNDIDASSNAVPCDGVDGTPDCPILYSGDYLGILTGYGAGAGYDKATGLGSLNVANVVNAWPLAPAPKVALSATSLTFAGTLVGTKAATQTVTLSNTGNAALALSGTGMGIGITGSGASGFSQTSNCGASVAAGASCTITVTFAPALKSAYAATLGIADNAAKSPQTVSLTGTGTAPAVNLSAAKLTFSATPVGASAATQKITLTNTGNGALTLSSIKISGTNATSYSQTNTCGTSVAAGANCAITVSFKPLSSGTLTASVGIADSAAGSPQSVTLTGTGTAPAVSLSAAKLTFAATPVGTAAAAQKVTVTNAGNGVLTLSSIKISGTNATSYAQTNTCGTSVAAGGKCVITVTFKPLSSGTLTASVVIADNAAGSPQSVALTGTGTAPLVSLSAAKLTFAATPVGTAAATQKVTLTNTGNGALALSSIKVSGTNATSFAQTSTCGASVAAGANCAIMVTFKPLSSGALTASVSIADNAAGSPQSVALTGTGTAPVVSLTATTLTFVGTAVGVSAKAQTVKLTNTGNGALTLMVPGTILGISIAGTDASSFSQTNNCGSSVAAGANCTITVGFKPSKKGTLNASVHIADNAAGSPQSVTLKGTGQ